MGKSRWKSKTHWVAAAITMLGVLEANSAVLQGLLGPYYGLSHIIIGLAMAGLREVTKEPLK